MWVSGRPGLELSRFEPRVAVVWSGTRAVSCPGGVVPRSDAGRHRGKLLQAQAWNEARSPVLRDRPARLRIRGLDTDGDPGPTLVLE